MINQGYITILKVFRLTPLSCRRGKITRRGIAKGFAKHGDKITRRGISQRFRDLQHGFAAQALRNYGTELQTRGAAAIRLSRLASERLQQNRDAGNSAP